MLYRAALCGVGSIVVSITAFHVLNGTYEVSGSDHCAFCRTESDSNALRTLNSLLKAQERERALERNNPGQAVIWLLKNCVGKLFTLSLLSFLPCKRNITISTLGLFWGQDKIKSAKCISHYRQGSLLTIWWNRAGACATKCNKGISDWNLELENLGQEHLFHLTQIWSRICLWRDPIVFLQEESTEWSSRQLPRGMQAQTNGSNSFIIWLSNPPRIWSSKLRTKQASRAQRGVTASSLTRKKAESNKGQHQN